MNNYNGIGEIRVFNIGKLFKTKSEGELSVFFALPIKALNGRFFKYDSMELKRIPRDIRGLRTYAVQGLSEGSVGGKEFHRIREEILICTRGKIILTCEDIFGKKKEIVMIPGQAIWIPPFILHTYEVMENKSGILAVANTLFFPDDPRTHDTYSLEAFREIQGNEF